MVDVYSAKWEEMPGQIQRGIFIGEPLGYMGHGLISYPDEQYYLENDADLPRLIGNIRFHMPRNSCPMTVEDTVVQPVIDEIERLESGELSSPRLTSAVNLFLRKIGLN